MRKNPIVRPIPEKSAGMFSPKAPDDLDELRIKGKVRFTPTRKKDERR